MIISTIGRRIISNRFFQQIRTGYIVLLPEANPEQLDHNPLYKNGIPDIENLTQEKCVSTFGKYLLDFEHSVRQVEDDIVEKQDELELFDDVIDTLEECGTNLEATWGLVKALYLADRNIMPSESYLSLHERARKARSLKYNSKHLYNFLKNSDASKLPEEEQRVISKFLIEGKLNGLSLDDKKRERFAEISKKIGIEVSKFNERVKISAQSFSHVIQDPTIVKEFPEELLKSMSLSEDPHKGPWKITLKIMDQFLKYCPNRNLRWNVWLASRQVAFSERSRELNNSQSLEGIRIYRRDLANVLGYDSYAHMAMETKMAGTLENVRNTLGSVLEVAKTHQEKELNLLQNFAEENGFNHSLELWDIPFWERKQQISLYHWDDLKMKEYFPYNKVFNGLLKIVSKFLDLKFVEATNIKTWHPDCKVYNIHDTNVSKPIASLYIDPFKRDTKLFTEMGQVISMRPAARALGPTPPSAALILNFPAPSSSDHQTSLLSLQEVIVLFSRFGEALQQVLSAVNYLEVSGLNNVEWDAVKIVSHFMCLLLTDPEIVREISGHYITKETIPVTNLVPIIGHMPGYHLSNEIYLANLDLNLHDSKEFWIVLMRQLWSQHFCIPLHKSDVHPLSFTASISQGTSCAVYSTVWSKLLAADAYNTFKTDPDKSNIGGRFRDTFLAFGGGCHPSEVFRRFQGRDPTSEAFLASTFPSSI